MEKFSGSQEGPVDQKRVEIGLGEHLSDVKAGDSDKVIGLGGVVQQRLQRDHSNGGVFVHNQVGILTILDEGFLLGGQFQAGVHFGKFSQIEPVQLFEAVGLVELVGNVAQVVRQEMGTQANGRKDQNRTGQEVDQLKLHIGASPELGKKIGESVGHCVVVVKKIRGTNDQTNGPKCHGNWVPKNVPVTCSLKLPIIVPVKSKRGFGVVWGQAGLGQRGLGVGAQRLVEIHGFLGHHCSALSFAPTWAPSRACTREIGFLHRAPVLSCTPSSIPLYSISLMPMSSDDVHLPIPQYPPFELRSSLIDKDPVIWVHLLHAYNQLLQLLVDPPEFFKLSVRTQQQLQYFVKVFLSETSQEGTRIFSLGAINPDIKANTASLRALVFQLVKAYSIVKLNLTGEAVWHFICIYAPGNSTTVRSLVDGTFKSKLNDNKKSGNISSIPLVHTHLQTIITSGKFTHHDLEALSHLLGQSIAAAKAQVFNITGAGRGDRKKVNAKSNSTQFAEKFVTGAWIELLESLYAGGSSVNASTIEHVMVISMVSLSPAKLAKFVTGMGINSPEGLKLYPLFSAILISDSLLNLSPGIREKLPFLNSLKFSSEVSPLPSASVNDNDIDTLLDLFPQMTRGQAKTLLLDNDHNVERATNILLELPDIIDSIKEFKELDETVQPAASSVARFTNSVKGDTPVRRKDPVVSTEELQKKTLSAAIRLMYESDEDEPDDTYDDQETTTTGSEKDVRQEREKGLETRQAIDANSRYLFLAFKLNNEALTRAARKSAERQALKKATGMTDEQIEGWFRLLLKSPRRFKILEEDYFYGGNPNRRNGKEQPKETEKEAKTETKEKETKEVPNSKPKSKEQIQRAQKRNEAHKSSRANHSRKSRHDKKTQGALVGMQ